MISVYRGTSLTSVIDNNNVEVVPSNKNIPPGKEEPIQETENSNFEIDKDLYNYLISIDQDNRINPIYSILSLEIAKILQPIVRNTNMDISTSSDSVIALVNNENYNIKVTDINIFLLLIYNKIYKISLAAQNQNGISFDNHLCKSKQLLKNIANMLYFIYNYNN